jgi:hypothetical protein
VTTSRFFLPNFLEFGNIIFEFIKKRDHWSTAGSKKSPLYKRHANFILTGKIPKDLEIHSSGGCLFTERPKRLKQLQHGLALLQQTLYRPPSFQLIFQILPEATLHQLLPESRF